MFAIESSNLGKRWVKTPEKIRQLYINDLERISQLLDEATQLEQWNQQQKAALDQSPHNVNQVYNELKQQLLSHQKELYQLIFEKRLALKRDNEAHQLQQLKEQELAAVQRQKEVLNQLNQHIQQESLEYAERYQKNTHSPYLQQVERNESLRLRLELEAETVIQSYIQQLRQQLREAAKEEINLILEQQAK